MAGSGVLIKSLGNGVIINQNGTPISGHSVFVYQTGTTNQVQVYSDLALTVPVTQPLTTGSDGTAGSIPGYIAGEQGVDFYDQTAGIRVQANPVASEDLATAGISASGLPSSVANGTPTNQSVFVGNGSAWVPVAVGSDGQWMVVRSDGTIGYVDGVIYASAWGIQANSAADQTAKCQAVLDAAVTPITGLSGANLPCKKVIFPAGRIVTSAPLLLNSNQVIEGAGSASTYFVASIPVGGDTYTDAAIMLKTGVEVQCELRNFGIIANTGVTDGIQLVQTGGSSILGDTRHIIDNVVVVGGSTALALDDSTEVRVNNFTGQRQTLNAASRYAAVLWVGGTDHMISHVTLGQPNGSYAFRAQTANTRGENIKVYGGGGGIAFAGGTNRNQWVACEVQDYDGTAYNVGGPGVVLGCLADSCSGTLLSVSTGAPGLIVRGFMALTRVGGAYTFTHALDLPDGAGADIDMLIQGTGQYVFQSGSQTGAGNRVRLNGQRGAVVAQASYASTYTPDPLTGSDHLLATLTGAVTIANPASSASYGSFLYKGMRLTFELTQDGTGGRAVTFGNTYKPFAAIPTGASTTTIIAFVYDGTYWQEESRTGGSGAPPNFTESRTFSVSGAIAVPSGATNFIPPFFEPVDSGVTKTLVNVRYAIRAGTSVTFAVTQNGSNVSGLGSLSAASTPAATAPSSAPSVADGDEFAIVVSAISGSPDGLSVSLIFETTQ